MRSRFFLTTVLSIAIATPLAGAPAGLSPGASNPAATPFSTMTEDTRFDAYASAVDLIRRERYADAIPYLKNALYARPYEQGNIYAYLGFANYKIGKTAAGMQYLKFALQEDSDNKKAREYLGDIYLDGRDLSSAKARLGELAGLCPSGCDELDALTKSITAFEAAYPPTATPAATSPMPSGGGK
jgi:tetratricopeptide (TPR) repeat protein